MMCQLISCVFYFIMTTSNTLKQTHTHAFGKLRKSIKKKTDHIGTYETTFVFNKKHFREINFLTDGFFVVTLRRI